MNQGLLLSKFGLNWDLMEKIYSLCYHLTKARTKVNRVINGTWAWYNKKVICVLWVSPILTSLPKDPAGPSALDLGESSHNIHVEVSLLAEPDPSSCPTSSSALPWRSHKKTSKNILPRWSPAGHSAPCQCLSLPSAAAAEDSSSYTPASES